MVDLALAVFIAVFQLVNDRPDSGRVNADPVQESGSIAAPNDIPELLNVYPDLIHKDQIAVLGKIHVAGSL